MSTRTRTRLGLGLTAGAAIAALSLILTPLTATADDGAGGDPAVAEAPAVDSAADPAAAPEPAEVVVAEPGVTAEEALAEPVEEPTVTIFAEEAAAAEAPVAAAAPEPGDPCYPAVCIDNGTILLAVNPTGELNTSNGEGSPAGPGDAGLDYLPTNNDATSPGCLCEGWGVADPASGVWGGADLDTEGSGGTNLVVESFEHTGSTAKSVVIVQDDAAAPVFRVTHEYVPSPATPNLYQVNVTIQNLTGATIATVQYRRVMDWDIEPTAFSEFVTIDGGSASALTYTSDDGFASPNPLSGPSSLGFEGNAVDNGPFDHGALFDFAFGPIASGGSVSFVIFYGAAATEDDAEAALAAVGAEAYSFGQTSTDPVTGTPNTFIFAFGKVGGRAIFGASLPTAAPASAPVAVPAPVVSTAVVTAETETETTATSPALASTGVQTGDVLWIALLVLLAGFAIVLATSMVRRSRA